MPKYEGIFDREHPRKLPIADYQIQPKIKGRITGKITIYTTGEGDLARNLRVEGFDENNNPGYYEKKLTDNVWKFFKADIDIRKKDLIDNVLDDRSRENLGENKDFEYDGVFDNGHISLKNFNLHDSPAKMRIETGHGKFYDFLLHTVIKMRYTIRDNPGYDGTSLELGGVIEIPLQVAGDTDPDLKKYLKRYFGYEAGDKSRFIKVKVNATLNKVVIEKDFPFSNFKYDLLRKGSDEKSDGELMTSSYLDKMKFEKSIESKIKYDAVTRFEFGTETFKNEKIIILKHSDGDPLMMTLSFCDIERELFARSNLNIFEIIYELITGKSSKLICPENPVKHRVILSIDELSENENIKKSVKSIFNGKNKIDCTLSNYGSFFELRDDKSRMHLKWKAIN
jgi:hypothetical protein